MSVLSVAFRKIKTAATFSWTELALVPVVFVALGLARLVILVLPFRRYAGLFGAQVGLSAAPIPASDRDEGRAGAIGRVVPTTAKITPWASLCLVQAMAASVLLRAGGVPFQVFFGVARKDEQDSTDPLEAHCWVRVGEGNVTGGRNNRRFTVVQVFSRPRSAA